MDGRGGAVGVCWCVHCLCLDFIDFQPYVLRALAHLRKGKGMKTMADILILAGIVAFLVFQLYRVLGQRDEDQSMPGPDPFAPQAQEASPINPLDRAAGAKPVQATVLEPAKATGPLSVNQGLAQIREYDADFDERGFVQGARAAFEMILKAYARGDLETLKNLLSPKLYEQFAEDAKARAAKDYVMETTLHSLSSATIVAARMVEFDAEVSVEFISEQTTAVRDASGNVVAGSADAREEVRDTWTFRRDTRTQDPVWLLTETRD